MENKLVTKTTFTFQKAEILKTDLKLMALNLFWLMSIKFKLVCLGVSK
jgi:hypothetical protein